MGLRQTDFNSFTTVDPRHPEASFKSQVELFVSTGYCALELASVTQTFKTINDILERDAFTWRFVSDEPGLVSDGSGMMVRAEPAIQNHGFSDLMIVVGGAQAAKTRWLSRARAMQRRALPVVLLSDAATGFIRATKSPAGKITTHWRDIDLLSETGYHPNLTTRFSENSDGIITAAGAGATSELVIGLIAPLLKSEQVAEMGRRLLLHSIRKASAEQPRNIADSAGLFDSHVSQAIHLMQDNLAEPMPMLELAQKVGLSARQMERVFRKAFNDTPAKFYKRLRTKRARTMIEETHLPMIDIAVATGFSSCDTLAKAVQAEYGQTPSKMRRRNEAELRSFAAA